ncbi:Hypothetical protein A7982_11213 [Minicystis rosea]|nr:Hypothetical protein A7982_11213 [Minicystis rosea]
MSGCSSEAPLPMAPAPQPTPPPLALPAQQAAAPAPAAAPVVDPNSIDVARIPLVLEDPRLAAVKAEADREGYARAAQILTTMIAGAAPEDRPVWLYQLGRLRALGGDPAGAAKAFEDSAAAGYVLENHARLQAAQWLVGIGQFDAAIADAKLCAEQALAGPVDLVMADALLGKKDFAGAAKHFRAYLGRDKHPPQWVNVALRFANALLQHPTEAHAEEALRLARRVAWEASGGQGQGRRRTSRRRRSRRCPPTSERRSRSSPPKSSSCGRAASCSRGSRGRP